MSDLSYMDRCYADIAGRIRAAETRAGGGPVSLVAAVKYTDAEHINYLCHTLGVRDIGENRVQQLLEHWESIDREGVRFHFIGTLQKNKVKYVVDKVALIHSLDSLSLAEEIERQAVKRNLQVRVLVEINSGGESQKGGVLPAEAEAFCRALGDFPHVELAGFMTMAPKCEKKEDYRKYFRETSSLCLDIWQKKLHNIGRPILSMGMSDSFEVAIEEGATVVRVGRALFTAPTEER